MTTPWDPASYRFLQDYVQRESGIVLDGDKHYLIEARLTPIVREAKLNSLDDLCALLRGVAEPALRQKVVDSITTNETQFFREPQHYQALRTFVLPPLIEERRKTRQLSFWSAAASTGQEAYSLAMMLVDMGLRDWRLRILGTDLSARAIERARKAVFPQIEVNRGLPASLLVRHFNRVGLDWKLKDDVRRMVSFERFDLRRNMSSIGIFDVVFCRNVLIYFDCETRREILTQVRTTLVPGGYLLLGASENTMGPAGAYERVVVGDTILYRRP